MTLMNMIFQVLKEEICLFSASGNKVTEPSCQDSLLGSQEHWSWAIQEPSRVLLTYKHAFFVEHSLGVTLVLLLML